MSLSIIVAVAVNGVIGKDNQLIWHLSDDLKWFKLWENLSLWEEKHLKVFQGFYRAGHTLFCPDEKITRCQTE